MVIFNFYCSMKWVVKFITETLEFALIHKVNSIKCKRYLKMLSDVNSFCYLDKMLVS